MIHSEEERPPATSEPAPAPPDAARVLRSEDLFAGGRLVIIDHGGALYRLQITARGRLILQK